MVGKGIVVVEVVVAAAVTAEGAATAEKDRTTAQWDLTPNTAAIDLPLVG